MGQMKEPSTFTPSSPGLSQLFDAIFERMLRMPGMFDNDDMRVLEKVQDVLAQPDDWMGEVGEIAIQLRSSGFAVVDGPILKSLIPVIQRAASSEIAPPEPVELVADPEREGMESMTGILVRAKDAQGRWESLDIAELDRRSLHAWLRSRGGKNMYAENVVLALLGHAQLIEALDV